MSKVLAGAKAFIRTVYVIGEPMVDELSDDLERLIATEGAELALGSEEEWDNEAMIKVANLMKGSAERLLAKLEAGDPEFGNPAPTGGDGGGDAGTDVA